MQLVVFLFQNHDQDMVEYGKKCKFCSFGKIELTEKIKKVK